MFLEFNGKLVISLIWVSLCFSHVCVVLFFIFSFAALL